MQYLLIDSPGDPNLPFVKDLYYSAFPKKERREWDELTEMLGSVPEMQLQVIVEGGEPVGMITSWKLRDWHFIEHFAISEMQRGNGCGQNVMKDFLEDGKVLLEVEPPSNAEAIRRIKFYERVGMACLDFPYLQPPYRKTGKPYEMVLMSNVTGDDEAETAEIVKLIFEKVYNSPGGYSQL
ncbi:GNAT family N-acetyltransferase [Pedobacter hartonius]|uniref:Acetyltransferase (GNAT) domain-containing protein n=1 Tax=Pedobacter hartonius TaxID=425514 RepID=A0A1H3X1K8_9SPHI|nr:GNAT family N-acetyltransferase [Pedobacter hartonius]SDZ92524.1 Acetyltransferase (GNAT) domain-containing protein [Pedobacter hartonius]